MPSRLSSAAVTLIANVEGLRRPAPLARAAACSTRPSGPSPATAGRPAAAATSAGSTFWPAKRGFDQRLALLDLAGARLGRGGQADACRAGARQAAQWRSWPSRQAASGRRKRKAWTGAETRKRRRRDAVMDKEVPVAEQCVRCGQHLRHEPLAPNASGHAQKHGRLNTIDQRSSPAPAADLADCPPRTGASRTVLEWLMISTSATAMPG